MTILRELRERRPDLLDNKDFHVFVDGGVKRGTDVLKALCLGARGVGLGRPFLYANSVWGEDGVRRAVQSECHASLPHFPLSLLTSTNHFSYERRNHHWDAPNGSDFARST